MDTGLQVGSHRNGVKGENHIPDVAGLLKPRDIPIDQVLELHQVLLDGILSLRRVNHTTSLSVVSKLAEYFV